MTYNQIKDEVQKLLSETNSLTSPVKVEEIARSKGIKVVPYPLGEDVSGILTWDKGVATIGYNQSDPRVRRRFTVAHELGHFILHIKNHSSQIFVDKDFKVLFRSNFSNAEPETVRQEREANFFAACLLMPEELIRKAIEETELELGNEDSLRQLARAFDVSLSSMNYRLINLGLDKNSY